MVSLVGAYCERLLSRRENFSFLLVRFKSLRWLLSLRYCFGVFESVAMLLAIIGIDC